MNDRIATGIATFALKVAIALAVAANALAAPDVTPIVMHPDGNLRLAAAPSVEMDVATRNMTPAKPPAKVWSTREKLGMTALVASAVADEVTTHQGLSSGKCHEAGAVKSSGGRIALKALLIAGAWAWTEYGDGDTGIAMMALAAIWGGVAIHNASLKC